MGITQLAKETAAKKLTWLPVVELELDRTANSVRDSTYSPNGRFQLVAFVSSELEVKWAGDGIVEDEVKEALAEFISDLE